VLVQWPPLNAADRTTDYISRVILKLKNHLAVGERLPRRSAQTQSLNGDPSPMVPSFPRRRDRAQAMPEARQAPSRHRPAPGGPDFRGWAVSPSLYEDSSVRLSRGQIPPNRSIRGWTAASASSAVIALGEGLSWAELQPKRRQLRPRLKTKALRIDLPVAACGPFSTLGTGLFFLPIVFPMRAFWEDRESVNLV
jgi:hypothetical protein